VIIVGRLGALRMQAVITAYQADTVGLATSTGGRLFTGRVHVQRKDDRSYAVTGGRRVAQIYGRMKQKTPDGMRQAHTCYSLGDMLLWDLGGAHIYQ